MTVAPVPGPPSDRPLHGASAGEAYRRFWQRFAVFTGRAGRAEYWWPQLINTLVLIGLAVLIGVVALIGEGLQGTGSPAAAVTNALVAVLGLVLALFALALIVPAIALSVRRLHDVDLSGLLVLVGLIPSVGGLILLVLHVLPPSPQGQRYDRVADGRADDAAAVPVAALGAPAETIQVPAFDAWPASPVTAPVPVHVRDGLDEPSAAPDDALRRTWSSLGEVAPVAPPRSAPPAWRRQDYLRVTTVDGVDVLATDGLSRNEGAAALGTGAEVFLAGPATGAPEVEVAEQWRFATLAAVASRITASGLHLPSELEQYGTLSMTVPSPLAPEGWRTPEGGVGVLIGLPAPTVPETVATAGGEVRLASVVPLTPAELQEVLDGGSPARARVAARLAALPPQDLVARG